MATYFGRVMSGCYFAKGHRFVIIVCLLSWGGLTLSADEMRIWKDASGKFELEASLSKVADGKVHLRRKDGRELIIAVAKLSAADQAYLEKMPAESPFQATEPAQEFNSPLVIVSASDGKHSMHFPAIVYSVREDAAFVVADTMRGNIFGPTGRFPEKTPLKFTATWQADGGIGKQALEEVSLINDHGKWIFRGPAKQLPPSLETLPTIKPTTNQAVELRAIKFIQGAFTDSKIPATIKEVFQDFDGQVTRFQVTPESKPVSHVTLVVTASGQVVGIVDSGSNTNATVGLNVYGMPVRPKYFWEEPIITRVHVVPVSGDAKTIYWIVAVEYHDLLKKMEQPYLLCRRLPRNKNGSPDLTEGRRTGKRLEPTDEGVVKINLKPGQLPETSLEILRNLRADPSDQLLIGEWEENNPGSMTTHEFDFQVGYLPKGIEAPNWLRRTTSTFHSQWFKSKPNGVELPAIPGFEGRPIDQPLARTVVSGKQVTSELTLPKEQPSSELPPDAPIPDTSHWYVASRITKHDGMESMNLSLNPTIRQYGDNRRQQAAISPDGNYLYLINKDGLLHKVDSRNFKVLASLQLPPESSQLGIAQAGLIVNNRKAGRLWQLDANTLAVRKVYIIQDVSGLGVSPKSNLCFTLGLRITPNLQERRLMMLDLDSGKVLQSIPFSRQAFRTSDGPIFEDP